MQLSHNLNARADVLKKLCQMHKDLNSAIMFMEKHNDREPLDEIYTELDYLIENERNKRLQKKYKNTQPLEKVQERLENLIKHETNQLLQETKKPKG